jgi:protein SCO1
MRGTLISIAVLSAVLGGLVAFWFVPGASNSLLGPATTTTGTALVGGPFQLTDHTGKTVTEKDFTGTKMLVFFGFTHCPDVCPSALQVMSVALDKLGDKARDVTPVFVSVDPERDTPEKMAAYVASFHPRLIGLTGTPEQVKAAAKAYRVYFKKAKPEPGQDNYNVDHTSIIYLMNEQGAFVKHFNHPTSASKFASELEPFL